MQNIYTLWAINTQTNHQFMELFTNIQNLNTFLSNYPYIQKQQITLHELNPN